MKLYLVIAVLLMTMFTCRAQFTDCSTGLLQMPTADMQDDGTFMITTVMFSVLEWLGTSFGPCRRIS